MAKKLDYTYCKASPMLEWFGNKWTLVTLITIAGGEPMRFTDIYRVIPSVSEKVLSQTLRQLTVDGLLTRTIYPDVPPRVEYALTELGQTLIPLLHALMAWGQSNFDKIIANRNSMQ